MQTIGAGASAATGSIEECKQGSIRSSGQAFTLAQTVDAHNERIPKPKKKLTKKKKTK